MNNLFQQHLLFSTLNNIASTDDGAVKITELLGELATEDEKIELLGAVLHTAYIIGADQNLQDQLTRLVVEQALQYVRGQ